LRLLRLQRALQDDLARAKSAALAARRLLADVTHPVLIDRRTAVGAFAERLAPGEVQGVGGGLTLDGGSSGQDIEGVGEPHRVGALEAPVRLRVHRRVHRGRAACGFRVPPRARGRHRALQGPVAWPILPVGRHRRGRRRHRRSGG